MGDRVAYTCVLALKHVGAIPSIVRAYIPCFGEVGPKFNHSVAERSLFVAVYVSVLATMGNAEHVVDLVSVKGVAGPTRPRITRSAMVERIHVHLVTSAGFALQQQHMQSTVQDQARSQKFTTGGGLRPICLRPFFTQVCWIVLYEFCSKCHTPFLTVKEF